MSLFDLFSEDPAKEAAEAQAAGLRTGRNRAVGALRDGTGAAISAVEDYYGRALDTFAPVSAQYDELWDRGIGALDTYRGALGLDGQEGYDAALGAFQTSPGFEYIRDQSLEGIKRHAASQGMLASGNTTQDMADYLMATLSQQEWQPWLNRLQGASTLAQPNPTPSMMAQILTSAGDRISGFESGAGRDIANVEYDAATGIGDANAQRALAPYYAGANQFNAMAQLLTGAATAAGLGGFGPPTPGA